MRVVVKQSGENSGNRVDRSTVITQLVNCVQSLYIDVYERVVDLQEKKKLSQSLTIQLTQCMLRTRPLRSRFWWTSFDMYPTFLIIVRNENLYLNHDANCKMTA
ncbi:hypothetical protein EVAR_79035_1 [Eumeta japonica]|uniref:Uncharacterized protein n=1 Tax=Eumeta variegata TaxID=151549 RepID=A0A4C1XU91_EUMVA|nr:hypothetical protein EVAR_79035_1 [Eumeta japonica]